MKTKEQWANEYNKRYRDLEREADKKVGDDIVPSEHIHEIIINEIQLDAFKAGAKWAATHIENINHPEVGLLASIMHGDRNRALILSATEQLTKLP